MTLSGCGGGETAAPPFPPTTLQAVSSAAVPEGSAPPTQEQRPRAVPAVPERASAPTFRLEPVARGFTEPVYVASAPGGGDTLYVVERAGRVIGLIGGERAGEPLLDIRERVRTEIEEGLHSVAFHPDYAKNGRLFAAFNDRGGDLRVVEYHAEEGRADESTAREVLAIDKTGGVRWHNGGQLQFGPDGLLYVSTGDSARNPYDDLGDPPEIVDPDNNAQNRGLLFGKLIRLDVDDREPRPEIVAYGLRNPWRFSFDRETGDLFIGDVGQFEREELDFVPAAEIDELANFGWSVYEGERDFNADHTLTTGGRLRWPLLAYPHPPDALYCTNVRGTIVGGYVYRGEDVPALRGRYVFGDWCSGELWTLRMQNGRATEVRKEPADVITLVSFGEDAGGELYAVAQTDGTIYRVAALEPSGS